MVRRWMAAGVIALVACLGLASATSLGTFDDIALSGTTLDRTPCTVTDVDILDSTLGGVVDLLTTPLTVLSEIDTVRLHGLSGDCEQFSPVVVIGGLDLIAGGDEQVLFVETLDPVPVGAPDPLDLPIGPIDLGDDLSLIYYDLSAVNVAFCPPGHTCQP